MSSFFPSIPPFFAIMTTSAEFPILPLPTLDRLNATIPADLDAKHVATAWFEAFTSSILSPGGDIESAVAGVQSKVLEQVHGPLREEVIWALVNAMQKVFILISVAGGVMLLSALCMKREKLFEVAAVAAA